MGSCGLWVQPNVNSIEGFITLTVHVHMNQVLKFVIEKKNEKQAVSLLLLSRNDCIARNVVIHV